MTLIILFIVASGVLSFSLNAIFMKRFGALLLAHPNERSTHTTPTPQSGGLGFVAAFGLTSIAWGFISPDTPIAAPNPVILWIVVLTMVGLGFIDDWNLITKRSVSASLRYLVHLGVAGAVVYSLGPFPFPLAGILDLGNWEITLMAVLSVVAFTGFVNLYNFMDGLDGLVGGCVAVQLGFLAHYFGQPVLWLLSGALLGFLWLNWMPAKLYMGDTGSTVLGSIVVVSLLSGSKDLEVVYSAIPIVLPILGDAAYTIIRRLVRGENILKDHRFHLYQRLSDVGWPANRIAAAYIGTTALIAGCIVLLGGTGAWISVLIVIGGILLGETLVKSSTGSLGS
jgi:Fuc2NAc and GlcNAc transferase